MVDEKRLRHAPGRDRRRRMIAALGAIGGAAVMLALLYLMFMNPSTALSKDVHDADGDGYADSVDAFPTLASEHSDSDGDGVGDNSDAFPDLASENLDSDNDGVGDNADAFPNDATQQMDGDGDGYGDNASGRDADRFPNDPSEWEDSDFDGIGNHADIYDLGNGKLNFSVAWYQGDGTADPSTAGDPYFTFLVDIDNDGTYDQNHTSPVFADVELLVNPYSVIVDVPDDMVSIGFALYIHDSDAPGTDQPIDYTQEASSNSNAHVAYAPFASSWQYDGNYDWPSEIDCKVVYRVSVTG